jgi:N-acetylglutamate synthase-like GNAT family acetyltransferase
MPFLNSGFRARRNRSALILRNRFLDSPLMKLVRWRRFTWDLSKLPVQECPLPAHYNLREASREDSRAVHTAISSAFSQDTAWSDTFITFRDRLDQQIDEAFEREGIPALVITHGQRIIAASALDTELDAETHLISGPCVLIEYRNRGLGTALLQASLQHLKRCGLPRVHGICKDTAPTSKFVYPKFGSISAVYSFEPSVIEP